MSNKDWVSRRQFLRVSALGAVTATIAGCGPQDPQQATTTDATTASEAVAPTLAPEAPAAATTAPEAPAAATTAPPAAPEGTTAPIAAPGTYKEAPMLAAMVEAGTLPPVDERLPENPYVPPHAWLQTGNYGGAMNWTNSWGGFGVSQIVCESMYGHSLLRWLKDGLEIGPGLAESWESNADTTEWTFNLRKGVRYSDGEPFTTDSIMFWWNDVVNVTEANEPPPDEAAPVPARWRSSRLSTNTR